MTDQMRTLIEIVTAWNEPVGRMLAGEIHRTDSVLLDRAQVISDLRQKLEEAKRA